MMRRVLWISALVVVLDQLTKWVALKYLTRHLEVPVIPFVNLTLVYNRGAAFGFLNNADGWQNLFFIAIALIACAVITYLILRLRQNDIMVGLALSLILGGAAGNLIDRFLHGYVIDFVDVYYGSWHWPAFNVADSAITVGAAVLVLDALGVGRRRRIA